MGRIKHVKKIIVLFILVAAVGYSYSWTSTPYGKLDYRAALSLRLLSFERAYKPDPNADFEFNLPVNMIYAFSALVPKEDVRETRDVAIPGDGVEVPARVYWPEGSENGDLPVLVYYHGGGFVVGSVDIFDPLARSLANATGAIVISVDYRLAPAHPYPAAVNDCFAALEWAASHAAELGGDVSQLIVAGDSAGGNLAAVTALKARDQGGPALVAQILYYPATDLTGKSYPSWEHFIDGYGLSSEASSAFHESYIGELHDSTGDPYISPLMAPSLAGLPPALVVTAGFDPLTDSARAYTDRMREEGVEVSSRLYPRMIHGFMSVSLFSQRRAALDETAEFLGRTLR